MGVGESQKQMLQSVLESQSLHVKAAYGFFLRCISCDV